MVDIYRPESLDDVLNIKRATKAIAFTGGTDLMVKLRRGAGTIPNFSKPVLFLDRCNELNHISRHFDHVEIGATITLRELIQSPYIHATLKEIISQMGGPALRNVATMAGNICNASPAGDTLPFLYDFGTSVTVISADSERTVLIEDFICGPGKTTMREDEILYSISIPLWEPDRYFFKKIGTRKANALTKVSFAAFADLSHGRISRARLALAAVAPTVVRLRDVERLLINSGSKELKNNLQSAVDICERQIDPIDDQRSTAAYRRRVSGNLVKYFIEKELLMALQ